MSKFILQSKMYDIELNLEHKNNVILGDSGSGKAFLCQLIDTISKDEYARSVFKSNFDLSSVQAIFNKTDLLGFDWDKGERVVFIDNTDLYMTKEDALKLNKSQNIFYIVSRDAGRKLPLELVLESLLTLHHTVEDGKHYLRTKYLI